MPPLMLRASDGRHLPFPFEGHTIVMGRKGDDVTEPIQGKKISKRHCKITLRDGVLVLEDESSNGTFVNREKLKKAERELQADDVLEFPAGEDDANLPMYIVVQPPPEPPQQPPPHMQPERA